MLDLTTAEDADALRARVVRAAVEVSGVPTAALLPLARDGAPPVAVGPLADRLAAWGPHEVAIAAGWVTAGTSSHFPGGEAVPPGYDFLQQAGVSGLSVHPLTVGGVLTDLLVTATDEPRRPAPTVVEALELLAVQAAASLALLEVRADLARARDDAERRAALTTAVLETVDVGVVACDARGRLTLFNRATRDFHRAAMDPELDPSAQPTAYDLREADGTTPLDPARVPLARVLAGETVRDAEIVIAAAGQPLRTVTCDGSLLRDGQGATDGAVVTMRDVTAARRAEAALAASEHLFRAAFVDGPTPTARLDEDGVVQAVNAALRRLLGGPGRLVVGRPLAALVHPDDHALLSACLQRGEPGRSPCSCGCAACPAARCGATRQPPGRPAGTGSRTCSCSWSTSRPGCTGSRSSSRRRDATPSPGSATAPRSTGCWPSPPGSARRSVCCSSTSTASRRSTTVRARRRRRRARRGGAAAAPCRPSG